MSDWQWFSEFAADARRRGDEERARLLQLHHEGFVLRETDPDAELLRFAEGRRLAAALGEPWWVLLFDHWTVHATLYHKQDFRHVLDPAVRNVLEVRKPRYTGFPQRLWIHNDLVTIYLTLDPWGYAEQAGQALAEAEAELTPDRDGSAYLLRENRVNLVLSLDRLDEALEIARATQARAQADPNRWVAEHHLMTTLGQLCTVARHRDDWAEVPAWAEAGEALARKRGYQRALCAFLVWQAVGAVRAGDRPPARRRYLSPLPPRARLKAPPAGLHGVLCVYHEQAGDLEKALRLREQQLVELARRGAVYAAFETRLARLRLLVQLGRAAGQDWEEARQAARQFLRPEPYLRKVEQIAAGGPAGGP